MRAEIERLTAELAASRQAALEGRGLEAEMERVREAELEYERQKRIAHTQEMAVRRIGRRDLAKGWMAWLTPYLERKHRMRMLAAAGARMAMPKLVACVKHWREDWQHEVSMRTKMGLREQLVEERRRARTAAARGPPSRSVAAPRASRALRTRLRRRSRC